MKKAILKNVNATMVEKLANFEHWKNGMFNSVKEFINKSSAQNKEELLKDYKQYLQEEETKEIVLGGRCNQYVLKYDESTNNIIFKDKINDNSFGVGIEDIDFDDEYSLVDIACSLNEQIETYLWKTIEEYEDCGEYWEITE